MIESLDDVFKFRVTKRSQYKRVDGVALAVINNIVNSCWSVPGGASSRLSPPGRLASHGLRLIRQ